MNFIKKIKDLTSSSKSKSLNDFRKELKQRQQKIDEFDKQRKNDDVGFSLQEKAIEAYKAKQFDEAENHFLQAMNKGFYSPGGLIYLAKIYRKRKDYDSEVKVLEKGLQRLKNDKENNFGKNLVKVEERLTKAKEYSNREHR